jgi:Leucyl-tRNA synthetase
MQVRIKEARAAMENIQTRRALQNAFYLILNDIKWYRKRGENPKVLWDVLDLWVRLLTPFIPHICEEIWSRMNGGPQNFISLARYPEVDEGKIDHSIEIEEDLLRDTIEDIREILAVTKIEPKKIVIYTAPEWKRDIYKTALKLKVKGALDMGSLMRTAIKDHANTRRISNFAKKMVREVELMGQAEVKILANSPVDEFETMKKAEDFISYEFGCEVSVFDAEFSKYDPAKKSDAAMPLRPAIYVE